MLQITPQMRILVAVEAVDGRKPGRVVFGLCPGSYVVRHEGCRNFGAYGAAHLRRSPQYRVRWTTNNPPKCA